MKPIRSWRWWTAAALALSLSGAAARAQTGTAVRDTVAGNIDIRRQTQISEDAWAGEKDALTARYRQARAAIAWLEERREVQSGRVTAIEGRVAELERRLAEADRLEGSLEDTLRVILERLDASVENTLPFLPEERAFRLKTLHDDMVRPDLAAAEKLRRLLEALQVETGYGSTVEVYQDAISVEGETVHADILRLGRVALFWMTPDRARGGVYDQGAAAWGTVDGGDLRRIGLAMDMAQRRRPAELVDLPVGRIAPEGTP